MLTLTFCLINAPILAMGEKLEITHKDAQILFGLIIDNKKRTISIPEEHLSMKDLKEKYLNKQSVSFNSCAWHQIFDYSKKFRQQRGDVFWSAALVYMVVFYFVIPLIVSGIIDMRQIFSADGCFTLLSCLYVSSMGLRAYFDVKKFNNFQAFLDELKAHKDTIEPEFIEE